MSRPRKKIKPLVRQMPRTTSISLTGSCGHETKERVSVDFWGDYNVTNLERLEVDKALRKEKALLSICLDCHANNRLRQIETNLKRLTDFLGLEDFVELEGTIRMKAYAAEVRGAMINDEFRNIISNVNSRLTSRTTIDQILLSTFKRAWTVDSLPSVPEDLTNLHTELNTLLIEPNFSLRNISHEVKGLPLAIWLLAKYRFLNYRRENRAKVWITLSRARYGSPMLVVENSPSEVYLSAIVVSQFNCWNNRDEAWEAFQILNQPTKGETSFLEQRTLEGEVSFNNFLLEIGVVNALKTFSLQMAGDPWR